MLFFEHFQAKSGAKCSKDFSDDADIIDNYYDVVGASSKQRKKRTNYADLDSGMPFINFITRQRTGEMWYVSAIRRQKNLARWK